MGTRSITVIMDEHQPDKEICRIYRQYDGYPSGHGADLARVCDVMIVNGLGADRTSKVANGMGCLAARIVEGLKEGAGGIYLYVPNDGEPDEEYTYIVTGKVGEKPVITCKHGDELVFSAPADGALDMISKLDPDPE